MTRVLLVDDDDDFRRMLMIALEHDGYVVEEACNGQEGIRRQRAAPADLVIIDILMPEQDGLETILALRREFPHIKIIAISGGGRMGTLNFLPLARIFGARRTLWKPFTLQELHEAMREVLQHQTP